jgi:hypothetical protein
MGECAALASPGCERFSRSGLKEVTSHPQCHNLILHSSKSVGSLFLPTRHDFVKSHRVTQSWTSIKLRRKMTPLSSSSSTKSFVSKFSGIPPDDPGTDPSAGCNAEKCQHGLDSFYHQTLGVDLGDRSTGVAVSWGDLGAPRQLQVRRATSIIHASSLRQTATNMDNTPLNFVASYLSGVQMCRTCRPVPGAPFLAEQELRSIPCRALLGLPI